MMNYLDSHTHLAGEEYIEDLPLVLDNMVNSGVTRAMLVCVSLDDYRRSLAIKREGVSFRRALGVYPEFVDISESEFAEYVKLFSLVDAIGEIGLDYHWYKDTKEKQQALFIRQLQLAYDLNKPVIIHARESLGDCFDILRRYPGRGVLHCYSGSADLAKEFVKLGYFISLAGPLTFKNAREPLEVVREVGVEHLLFETDCPYLTPVPFRGKKNEPSYVVYTARKMMEVLGLSEAEFLGQINRNYDALFGRD